MEYVQGCVLTALTPAGGPPVETVIRCGPQITGAIAWTYDRGVIHCDHWRTNVYLPRNAYPLRSLAWTYVTAGDWPAARRSLERPRTEGGKKYEEPVGWTVLPALEERREEPLKEMDEDVLKFAGGSRLATLEIAELYSVLEATAMRKVQRRAEVLARI